MSENVGHPMPASPLPWVDHGDGFLGCEYKEWEPDAHAHTTIKSMVCEVFEPMDFAYVQWACCSAPALAAEVARLRAALEGLMAVSDSDYPVLPSRLHNAKQADKEAWRDAFTAAWDAARAALAVSP